LATALAQARGWGRLAHPPSLPNPNPHHSVTLGRAT